MYLLLDYGDSLCDENYSTDDDEKVTRLISAESKKIHVHGKKSESAWKEILRNSNLCHDRIDEADVIYKFWHSVMIEYSVVSALRFIIINIIIQNIWLIVIVNDD